MAAYWMAHAKVTDAEAYAEYAKLAGPALDKHNGKFLARGGRSITLEGDAYERNIIVEFPTYDDAIACFESDEFQKACEHRIGAAVRHDVIVEGL